MPTDSTDIIAPIIRQVNADASAMIPHARQTFTFPI